MYQLTTIYSAIYVNVTVHLPLFQGGGTERLHFNIATIYCALLNGMLAFGQSPRLKHLLVKMICLLWP